jgi:hypothetical protein
MSVDFGLLSSAARVPMSGRPMQMNTPVENQAIKFDMQGKQILAQERQQEFDRSNQDRSTANAALQEEGVDLATVDGTQKYLEKIKGKTSPDFYLKQADHAAKIQQNAVANQQAILNLNDAQRGEYAKAIEPMVSELRAIDEAHTAEYKQNPEMADANLKAKAGLLAKKYSAMKGPTGAPLTPPQLIQDLENAPTHLIHGWVANSKEEVSRVLNAERIAKTKEYEAKAAKDTAEADILSGGVSKGSKMYTVPNDPDSYISTPYGKYYRKSAASGELVEIPRIPDGATSIGATPKILPQSVIDTAMDFDKKPPTAEELFQAKEMALTGKMPALGAGAAVAPARMRLNALAVKAKIEAGMDPNEAVQLANMVKTSQEGIKRLTTQHAQISSGEKNVKGVLNVMEDEIRKAKLSGSPKWDQFWSSQKTDWLGDPDYIGIAQAYKDLVESSARVYSGVTGASGTPVSFLQLAEKDMPEKPTLAQVAKLKDVLPKLFDIRKKATEEEITTLSNLSTLPTKKSSEPSPTTSTGGTSLTDRKVSDSEQKARDADAKAIQEKEMPKKLAAYNEAKDPLEKERAWNDVREIRHSQKTQRTLVEISEADLAAGKAQVGDVFNGKIFKGGIAKNKANWEKL